MKPSELQLKLKYGQIVTGCWERKSYTITKLIGRGGTGVVYLAKDKWGKPWAMKISTDVVGISHEHRILRFLNNRREVSGLTIVPKVMELDDFRIGSKVYHYIITEYCRGVNLGRYSGGLSLYNAAVIGRQVAEFLNRLHDQGFVFGDLKPGNLVYNFKSSMVYIVDFGSVTIKGQALKQYTPGYDRMSWGAGTRIADESYDVFALGLLLSTIILGKSCGKDKPDLPSLISRASDRIQNPMLRGTIAGILKQENFTTRDVVENLLLIIEEERSVKSLRASTWFVRIVGAASAAAFVLSLAYYYQ
jgi:serine/threonine-protein kinase